MEYVVPIITLIIGSILTFTFTIIHSKLESKRKFKEEHYCKLLESLTAFIGTTATPTNKQQFFNEYYKSWVYASDDVILEIKKLIDSVLIDSDVQVDGAQQIHNIVIAIRKDLKVKTKVPNKTFRYVSIVPYSRKN